MQDREDYIAEVKEKLDVLNARIAELEARANEKAGEARREFKARLSTLREANREAERKLEEARLASKEAWYEVRLGAEHAWKSLASAVERARHRLH